MGDADEDREPQDVLATIRRLVAEEVDETEADPSAASRAEAPGAPVDDAADPSAVAPESGAGEAPKAFVLGTALRVDSPKEPVMAGGARSTPSRDARVSETSTDEVADAAAAQTKAKKAPKDQPVDLGAFIAPQRETELPAQKRPAPPRQRLAEASPFLETEPTEALSDKVARLRSILSERAERDAAADPSAGGAQGASIDSIDAVALRALVTEVVQDELREGITQEMTRNLRMMVRREVRRALTRRGLE